jgi:hypothetical protein
MTTEHTETLPAFSRPPVMAAFQFFVPAVANPPKVFNILVENPVENAESTLVNGLLKATSTFCTEFCASAPACGEMSLRRTA